MKLSQHQQRQIAVINQIEAQLKDKTLSFTTVPPVADYENDLRICLTSVHLLRIELAQQIQKQIIDPLRTVRPAYYYYKINSLHMTIKNIRMVNNPPHFDNTAISKAREIFQKVIPSHKQFTVYFYKLMLLPNTLSLIGTTDVELDTIILDLDRELTTQGIPDDKVYANSKFFFINISLARYPEPLPKDFQKKVTEINDQLSLKPYTIDSVTLLSGNAVLEKRRSIETFQLQRR